MTNAGSLAGWHVLVPRGGSWGDEVAASLKRHGAVPVLAPMIEFLPPRDPESLTEAFDRLADGAFDWVVVTSATTVAEISRHRVRVPARTRIAAVGEITALRLAASGYRVDFVPTTDHSARGLVAEWPGPRPDGSSASPGRVLIPQSDLAAPSLAAGIRSLGFDVETVTAYRNVSVPVTEEVVAAVKAGRIHAMLLTSGSIARQVQDQFAPVPATTRIACIGEFTAADARAAGLRVDVIAREHTAASLVDSLADHARTGTTTEDRADRIPGSIPHTPDAIRHTPDSKEISHS